MNNISLRLLTGNSPFLRKPMIFYMSLPKVAMFDDYHLIISLNWQLAFS